MSGTLSLPLDDDDDACEASPGGVRRAPIVPQPAGWSGRGRKPGSRNLRTLALGRYVQARGYGDVAVQLVEIANARASDIARQVVGEALRLKGLPDDDAAIDAAVREMSLEAATGLIVEARKEQAAARKDVLPYLHAKMTPDVQVNVGQLPSIIIDLASGGGGEPRGHGELSILDFAEKTVADQELGAGDGGASHGAASHGEG